MQEKQSVKMSTEESVVRDRLGGETNSCLNSPIQILACESFSQRRVRRKAHWFARASLALVLEEAGPVPGPGLLLSESSSCCCFWCLLL